MRDRRDDEILPTAGGMLKLVGSITIRNNEISESDSRLKLGWENVERSAWQIAPIQFVPTFHDVNFIQEQDNLRVFQKSVWDDRFPQKNGVFL